LVTFSDLQLRLLQHLLTRVRNGELTERGLARMVGISQPHIHNVLKGVRTLSPELSDSILVHLRISLIDLLDRTQIAKYSGSDGNEYYESCYIPVLSDPIGPGLPWPCRIEESRRFLIDRRKVASFRNPIIARISPDARMLPAIHEGDFALLDQSQSAREQIDPDALYLIKSGSQALIRRVRQGQGNALYMVTEDSLQTPELWEKILLTCHELPHLIRARVYLVAPEKEDWWDRNQTLATSL